MSRKEPDIHGLSGYNRATRRRMLRDGSGDPIAELHKEYESNLHAMETVGQVFDATHQELDQSITAVAYKGPPTLLRLLALSKDNHRITNQALRANLKQGKAADAETIYRSAERSTFAEKINGVSLEDINALHTPLDESGIDTVFNIFKGHLRWQRRDTNHQGVVARSLTYLAIMPLAQRLSIGHTPESVRNLQSVTQDFLDYFVEIMRNGADSKTVIKMAYMIGRSRHLLQPAVAAYSAARLGISPSSVVKMFEATMFYTGPAKRFLEELSDDIKQAIPTHVPEDLRPFLAYDKQNDVKATEVILDHVKGDEKVSFTKDDLDSALKDFLTVKRNKLLFEVSKGRGKFSYKPTTESPIEMVVIIEPYVNSTVFILHLKGGSHLTLEIGEDEVIYGIPNDLYGEFPHIADFLIPHVLAIPFPQRTHKETSQTPITGTPAPLKRGLEVRPPTPSQTTEPPKRKVLRRLMSIGKEEDPDQDTVVGHTRHFFVEHSSHQIREMLGGQKADPQQIEKATQMLFRFERGAKNAKMLANHDQRQLSSLRSGDMRIILEHMGHDTYKIIAIGDREEAYKTVDPRGNSN